MNDMNFSGCSQNEKLWPCASHPPPSYVLNGWLSPMSFLGAFQGEVKERLHSGTFLIVSLTGEETPRALGKEHFRVFVWV